MSYKGSELYDGAGVLDIYTAHRSRPDNANDTLERPVVLDLLGDVANGKILDLGCGDAAVGAELLGRGALSYLGVDGSEAMVLRARAALAGTSGECVHADIETWVYPRVTFTHVLARLVLHWVRDLDRVLSEVSAALRPSGRLILSVEHPVITCCDRAWKEGGPRQDWVVDDYFRIGERATTWLGQEVLKYHRTVEDYFAALQSAGLVVESLRESRPDGRHFLQAETYERRKRVPLFLFLSARKPS